MEGAHGEDAVLAELLQFAVHEQAPMWRDEMYVYIGITKMVIRHTCITIMAVKSMYGKLGGKLRGLKLRNICASARKLVEQSGTI